MEIDKDGYELLEKEIESRGYLYRQVYVDVNRIYCIYEQLWPETKKRISFEVFKIKRSEETEIYGRKYGKKENFPGNNDFGKTAFSVTSLERAHQKIEFLEKKKEDQAQAALLPKKGKYIPTGKPRGRQKGWKKKVVN
jgi:hypothetical protein